MTLLLLFGSPGSKNWLPLLIPLVVLLALVRGIELLARHLKRRRIYKVNKLISDLQSPVSPDAGESAK